jgi:hypothetical protein
MHISGKIAAWFVAVGIVVSVYFAAKTLSIRDAWMKIAQENEKKIKDNDEEIARQIRIRDEKRTQLARTMFSWDRYWNDVQIVGQNAADKINLKLGASQGVQKDQVLYVFVPNADGTWSYLGDYKVLVAGDAQVEAKAHSRRRPAEAKQVAAQNARVRTMIPDPFLSRLGALDQQLLAAELTFKMNNDSLKSQGTLGELTEGQIAARMAEIDGNPALQGQALPNVNIKGLLNALKEEEEARHAALLEADRLMRDLKAARDEFARVRGENEKRIQSLPRPGATETTVGAASR